MGAPKLIGENEDVIRIMSIHKSKGLEFPVVFLSGTGNQFNLMDLNENILLHPKIGLGPKYINYDRKIQYNTLAKEAIKLQTKKEVLEEEMRLLYVALTRSREKMIITGLNKNVEKFIKLKQDLLKSNIRDGKIDVSSLKKAKSYLDWIELVNLYDARMKKLIDTKVYKAKDIIKEEETDNKETKIEIEEREINKEIDKIFNWKYDEEIEYKCELKKPKFIEEKLKLSRAEIGTAVHLVLQKLDFKIEYNLEKLEMLLNNLVDKKILTENQKSEIPKDKILMFIRLIMFQMMIIII